MKTKLALSAVAAAVAVFSQGAFAQASSPSRAEVKAEAKAAAKAPTGEAQTSRTQPSTMSDKSRAERKETTKTRQVRRQPEAAGEAAGVKEDKAMKSTGRKRPVPSARPRPRPPTRPARSRRLAKPAARRRQSSRRSRSRKRAVRAPRKKAALRAAFFFVLARLRPWRRGPGGCRAPRPPRAFLVELEQLGRLEQLGQRRVAVVARVERGLVADLLADGADARPAALARRRLDRVAQQVDELGVALQLGGRHAQRRRRAVVARQLAGVDVDRRRGRDRQLVEIEEARAGVDERLGRLLAPKP